MELLDISASPFKLHRQAKKIVKTTSRAKDPAWYQRANEIELQWHIWVGTDSLISAIYHKPSGTWADGPSLPQISFETEEIEKVVTGISESSRNALHELVRSILGNKDLPGKRKALGVQIHLADSIRIRELDPDFALDRDFDNLNELLISAPEIALGDDSVAGTGGAWRILPLFGADEEEKQSVAVQLNDKFGFISDEFQNYGELRGIPIIAEVTSAALEAFAGLPELFPEAGDFSNTLSLLQFDAFTLLCATGEGGTVSMVRPMPHRSGKTLTSAELADFITNTSALLNLKNPTVGLISMSGIARAELESLLSTYREYNPEANLHVINSAEIESAQDVPGNRFEFCFTTGSCEIEVNEAIPLFTARDKWATQDFASISADEEQRMPARGDLKLLQFASLGQKVAIVALLALIGWSGMDAFTKMKSEAWALDESASTEMRRQLASLEKERDAYDHYENLFVKRSEGWVAMETLLNLFPEKGGVILGSATYSASGVNDDEDDAAGIGIARRWSVNGYANPEIAKDLVSLGSKEKVSETFSRIAEENFSDYLAVDSDSRDLAVSFEQKQGTMPSSKAFPAGVARYYRVGFDLDVKHSFTGNDEFALNINNSEPEAP